MQSVLEFIVDHWWIELALVAIATFGTYSSFTIQKVPELRLVALAPSGKEDQELRELGFQFLGCCYDATMTPQVQMHVWAYLSADGLHAAWLASVKTSFESFSLLEFGSELSPHGNITTSTSKVANIYNFPPDKVVTKAPWKKRPTELFHLHEKLCRTASECQFTHAPMRPDDAREHLINDTRNDLEYLVECGRMVKVSPDSYRLSMKGAMIAVPRVWHKTIYGFLYGWVRPSDEALCRRLTDRLQKARALARPGCVS